MPVIDMIGLDTQSAPMAAIEEALKDHFNGFTSPAETINLITAISVEWAH